MILQIKSPKSVELICGHTKKAHSVFTKYDEEPTSFTLVGNSADSPAPNLRLPPAAGHGADILAPSLNTV